MPRTKKSDAAPPRRILNCLPSPSQETDWTFGSAVKAGIADTALPSSVDLRDDDWWGIGNQKDTGSCVGWATADSLLRYHFVKAKWIDQGERMSVRFTWMASKELDEFTQAPTTFIEPEGTSLKAALDVTRKYGSVLEEDLPFEGDLFADTAEVFYTKAARLKIASYTNLEQSPMSWRRWLANNGPILVRLNVDRTWDQVGADGLLEQYRPETARGGHAVALVGYDRGKFIVRNSWGKTWADKGFAYALDAYAAMAFTEAYGISLGGAAAVAPGTVHAEPRKTSAEVFAANGVSHNDIELLVVETARELRGAQVQLGDGVSRWFDDVEGLIELLGVLQDRLRVGQLLLSAPTAQIKKLLTGSFFGLSGWVFQRLQSVGGA